MKKKIKKWKIKRTRKRKGKERDESVGVEMRKDWMNERAANGDEEEGGGVVK